MNRRGFLRFLGAAALTGAVAAKLPTGLFSPALRKDKAIQMLMAFYRTMTLEQIRECALFVGRDLYEAYENELPYIRRIDDAHGKGFISLKFKGMTVVSTGYTGRVGWDIAAARLFTFKNAPLIPDSAVRRNVRYVMGSVERIHRAHRLL